MTSLGTHARQHSANLPDSGNWDSDGNGRSCDCDSILAEGGRFQRSFKCEESVLPQAYIYKKKKEQF